MPYDTTPVADRHLLDGVARREADALRALYQRHGESLYALSYGMLVDPGDAEEVVSETFAHLWRTPAPRHPQGAAPRPWGPARPSRGRGSPPPPPPSAPRRGCRRTRAVSRAVPAPSGRELTRLN